MSIDKQDTQLLPLPAPPYVINEPVEHRFRRIKAFADRTGIRYCVAYSRYEKQRKAMLALAARYPAPMRR